MKVVEDLSAKYDTQIKPKTQSSVIAIDLSENRVLILHNEGENKYLYGMICTISETEIIIETDTQLSTLDNSSIEKSAVKLSNNKIFIAHGNYSSISSGASVLYGIVCTINGTVINIGADTKLSDDGYAGNTISAVALSEEKVFIAHSDNAFSNPYLYGTLCTVSDMTITITKQTTVKMTGGAGKTISAVKLNENKVFIAHTYNSNQYLSGIICTVDTTITAGTDTQLTTNTYSGSYISVIVLSESRIFVTHTDGSPNQSLYGSICEISGTTITKRTDIQLSKNIGSGISVELLLLSENKLIIGHRSDNTNQVLCLMLCMINVDDILVENDIEVSSEINSGTWLSMLRLTQNEIFIAHSYSDNYYLYGMIVDKIKLAEVAARSDNIYGIATTSGQDGKIVKVVRPEIKEEL